MSKRDVYRNFIVLVWARMAEPVAYVIPFVYVNQSACCFIAPAQDWAWLTRFAMGSDRALRAKCPERQDWHLLRCSREPVCSRAVLDDVPLGQTQ